MSSWIERSAVALARLHAKPGWASLQLEKLIMFLMIIPLALVGGLALGYAGLFIGIGVGAALSFGLPVYGRRLDRRLTGRVYKPKQRREAVSKLLEASEGRLTSQRVADARLMIEAGLEREALLLIADDLRASSGGLDSSDVAALEGVTSKIGVKIGLDPQPDPHRP